jgi:hypothetical protein
MRSPVRLRASALAGHTAALREGYDQLVLPERGRHWPERELASTAGGPASERFQVSPPISVW